MTCAIIYGVDRRKQVACGGRSAERNAIMKSPSPVEEDVKRYNGYGKDFFCVPAYLFIVLILGRIWAFFYLGGETYA